MADVLWQPVAQARPQVDILTVTAVAVGAVFTATVNGKAVSYTSITGDTTATAAAGWASAFATATDGELTELVAANVSGAATVQVTGRADGAPFVLTVGATGGGTATTATTVTATGPADVANVTNYSTGALPAAGDRLIVENLATGLSFNLGALAALAVSVVRRPSHTGTIGLQDVSPQGYREYRKTHLETLGLAHFVETTRADAAHAVRLNNMGATGPVLTVVGDGPPAVGSEPVGFFNCTAGVVNVSNSGVAVARTAPRAAALASLRAVNSAVTVGALASVGAVTLTNSTAELFGSFTTVATDRGGACKVGRAASVATSVTLDAGSMSWESTGNPPAVSVGSGATLTLENAPAAVTAGTITLQEGATLLDPAARLVRPVAVVLQRTEVKLVTLDFGTGMTLTVT